MANSPFKILFTAAEIPMALPEGTSYADALKIAEQTAENNGPAKLVRDEGRGQYLLAEVDEYGTRTASGGKVGL